MSILFLFAYLFLAPAALTWMLVRFILSRKPGRSRSQILTIIVPLAAILPLLPAAVLIARATMINNAVLIAGMATLIVGGGVGLCVCLPVGMALTRHLHR